MTESVPADGASTVEPKPRRRWLWVLGGLLSLAVVFRIALPHATRWLIEGEGSKAIGLPITVESVDYGIFPGRFALVGLRVEGNAEGTADPLLTVDRAALDFDWTGLFRGELSLASVTLEAPAITVDRDEAGRLIIPIAPPPSEEEPAPASGSAGEGAPEETADGDAGWPIAIGAIELTDAKLTARDFDGADDTIQIAFERFGLGGLRVEGTGIAFADIVLARPSIRYRTDRAPTGLAGPMFATDEAEPEVIAEEAEAASPAAYRIDRLAVDEAGLVLQGSRGEPLEVRIRVLAENVSLEAGHRFPAEIELGIGDGSLTLKGEAGLLPPVFDGTLVWDQLALPPLARAVEHPATEWLRAGQSAGELKVSLRAGAPEGEATPPLARVSGSLRLDSLDFSAPDAEPRVAWGSLVVQAEEVVISATGEPPVVALASVELTSPRIAWARPADELNALFGAPVAETPEGANGETPPVEAAEATEPVEDSDAGGAPPQLTVARIAVSDGELSLDDQAVDPPFRDKVTGFELSLADFQLSPRRVHDIVAKGRSLGGGPFTVTGDVEPGSMDAELKLVREGLTDYNTYASNLGGYQIGRGAMTLSILVKGENDVTRATTELTLHDLRVTPRGEDTFSKVFGVPIGVALALLRDPGGDIAFTIPLEMNTEGVSSTITPILYDAFRQAVFGALASPLKTLGLVFDSAGGGSVEQDQAVGFVPGRARLTDEGEARGREIAQLLGERPELRIEAQGSIGEEDLRPLQEQRLLALRSEGADWPDVEGSGLLSRLRINRILEARERDEEREISAEDEALLTRLCAAVEVTEEQKQALASARAETARTVLVDAHGVNPAQVSILPGYSEGRSGVRVDLGVTEAIEE